MSKLDYISELRAILRQMEHDVGIDTLSPSERDVLLAAHSLTATPGDIVESDQIRSHAFVQATPPATFHRALRSLLELGMLEKAGGSKSKRYVVKAELFGE